MLPPHLQENSKKMIPMKHHSSINQYLGTTFSECVSGFEGIGYEHDSFYYNVHEGNVTFDGIKKISSFALEERSSVFSFYIPRTVKKIGVAAFRACKDLQSVKFDSDVELEEFEDSLFRDCISLNNIIIPQSVKKIGDWSFGGCRNLKKIELPEGITDIGDFAFSGCYSLEKIVFPGSLKSIGHFAFSGCSSLKEVVFAGECVSMGEGVFSCCTSLQSIILPEKQNAISNRLFSYCESLSALELPKEIKEIGSSAFRGCYSLRTIFIPENVSVLHSSSFRGCRSLKTIKLPQALKEIESCAFYSCESLSHITFPKTIKSIGNNAFFGCISLERVSLPQYMKYIGTGAFALCKSLTNITLPKDFDYQDVVGFASYHNALDIDQGLSIFYDCYNLSFEGIKNIRCKEDFDFFRESFHDEGRFPEIDERPLSKIDSADVQDVIIEHTSPNAEISNDELEKAISGYKGNIALKVLGNNKRVVFDADGWGADLDRVIKIIICEGIEEFEFGGAWNTHVQYYSFPKSIKRISMMPGVSSENKVCVVLKGQDVDVDYCSFKCASELHLNQITPIKEIHKWFIFNGILETWGDVWDCLAYMRQCTLYVPKGSKVFYMQNPEYELFKAVIEE